MTVQEREISTAIPKKIDALDLIRETAVLERLSSTFRMIFGEFSQNTHFSTKADGSLRSDVEVRIEETIAELLAEITPWAAVIGEEGATYGASTHESSFCWYIDPIDGTISFQHRLDSFSFVATLAYQGKAVAAVSVFPMLDREYTSVVDHGLCLNGTRVRIRPLASQGALVVSASDDYTFSLSNRHNLLPAIQNEEVIIRRYTDLYGHTLVAHGRCAAKFDAACARWDRLPAELFVKEAGGQTIFLPFENATEDLEGTLISYHPDAEDTVRRILARAGLIRVSDAK